MAQSAVVVEHIERVRILSTQVSRKKDELMVGLDQDWYDLSDKMQEQLFVEARRLGDEHHPTLKSDWTPYFYKYKTDQ